MLAIENNCTNYESCNFKSKRHIIKKSLSPEQIKNYTLYNQNQYKMGNITPKEYFQKSFKLINQLLNLCKPKNCSLRWYLNNKSRLNYVKNTKSDIVYKLKNMNIL